MSAFTISGLNGFVTRKAGSGRSPVSSRSGNAVMKITGTDAVVRMSFTASIPDVPSASWISARTHLRTGPVEKRPRFRVGARYADHAMPQALDHLLYIHCNQRFIFDDEHVGRNLPRYLRARLRQQPIEVRNVDVKDFGRLFVGEAFDGYQQECLARFWR